MVQDLFSIDLFYEREKIIELTSDDIEELDTNVGVPIASIKNEEVLEVLDEDIIDNNEDVCDNDISSFGYNTESMTAYCFIKQPDVIIGRMIEDELK